MAKRKQIEQERPVSSTLVKTREEVKMLLEAQITAAQPILDLVVSKHPHNSYDMFGSARYQGDKYDKAQQDEFFRQFHMWDNRCKEIFTRSFEHPNNTDLAGYEGTGVSYFISDIVEEQKSHIRDKVAYIRGFIDRLDLIPCLVDEPAAEPVSEKIIDKKKVFIVHGHNDALKVEVARTVEQMGLKAVILHEQEDYGKTIIEKFESNASDVGFAIVLLTADDMGVSKRDIERENIEKDFKAETRARARQNVVYEMGYFIGKLDREHVFELMETGVEKPGDLDGIIYTPVDSEGVWKFKLAKRLDAVGYSVNMKAILL